MSTFAFTRLSSGTIKVSINGDAQYIGMPVSIDPIGTNFIRISPAKGDVIEMNTDVETITANGATVTGTAAAISEVLATTIFFLTETVRVAYATAQWGVATIEKYGVTAMSSQGTATLRSLATTNLMTQTRRIGYVSASTGGSNASLRSTERFAWRGNAAGLGGFDYTLRFAISQTQTGYLFFAGLQNSIGALVATTSPNSLTDILGVGFRQGTDTNFQILHNDSSGTATATDTGIAPSTETVYSLRVKCYPNSSSATITLTNVGSGVSYTVTASSDIPASTTLLAQILHLSNNATAAAVSMEFVDLSINTLI